MRTHRSTTRRTRRAGALVLMLSVMVVPIRASADHGGPEAQQAAREIQAARDRANEASQAMFDAQSRLDVLAVDIVEAEAELAIVEAMAAEMRADLAEGALHDFVNSGSGSFPLLIDLDATSDDLAAEVLVGVAYGNAAIELDDYDAVTDELEAARVDLQRQQGEATDAEEQYAELKRKAEDEIVRLAEVERDRVNDELVQHELERQRAARLESEAAEAARAAAARPVGVSAPQSGSGSQGGGSPGGSSQGVVSATPSANPATNAPAGEAPESQPTPVESPAPSNAGSGIVCPVAGPRSFADTWGASRSGGRSHEGVDMMAPGGTPLVAVESGFAQFKSTSLGGNSIWVNGASGTRYFYAHLSAWEGSSRSVTQGDVIGYVGATGNTSTNHLHFEVHPGGGRAVNPYPYVRAVC